MQMNEYKLLFIMYFYTSGSLSFLTSNMDNKLKLYRLLRLI